MDATSSTYPLRFHPAIGAEPGRFRRLAMLLMHYRTELASLAGPVYVLLPTDLSDEHRHQLQAQLAELWPPPYKVHLLPCQPQRPCLHWLTLQQQLDRGQPLSLLAFDSPVPTVASHLLGGTASEGLMALSVQPADTGLALSTLAQGLHLTHAFSEEEAIDQALLRQCLATSSAPLHHLLPPAGCRQQTQWLDLYEHISERAADTLQIHHPEQALGELGALQLPYRLLYLQQLLDSEQQALMLDMASTGHRSFSLWHNASSTAHTNTPTSIEGEPYG
ncbi:hypothetical protein QCD60_10320 [Pokkaliibacter sp. MBI-7]|uniref:hypothetical protein n=1 Tax=Pokkaliibacter sp. MBI-7 TaxID=3040600 RepID=UPI00244BD64C|nr:hypothetical protein [Pokkaliibacter sp. MBI-7]MDH2432961.1 hypothetical protein [Pokkaliibacter sp. MBI-7]